MYETHSYEGMTAETVPVKGANGDWIHAYLSRPLGAGPFPGVVMVHHMPGWDSWYKEATRKMAANGYVAICPDLYHRSGPGSPDDVAAKVRAEGGVPDAQVAADLGGCVDYLKAMPQLNGKVGIFGTCSGGRHAYLAACQFDSLDAVMDLWGGGVVMAPDQLNEKRPVSPIDLTKDLRCPILGLFGEEDRAPTPEQVAQHEAALQAAGKQYEFHMYPDAGHGFFYHDRTAYRQSQAVDGWQKVFDFMARTLS